MLDHHRLAEQPLHVRLDPARHHIGAATGRKPEDEADRLGGERLRGGGLRRKAKRQREKPETKPRHIPSRFPLSGGRRNDSEGAANRVPSR